MGNSCCHTDLDATSNIPSTRNRNRLDHDFDSIQTGVSDSFLSTKSNKNQSSKKLNGQLQYEIFQANTYRQE